MHDTAAAAGTQTEPPKHPNMGLQQHVSQLAPPDPPPDRYIYYSGFSSESASMMYERRKNLQFVGTTRVQD